MALEYLQKVVDYLLDQQLRVGTRTQPGLDPVKSGEVRNPGGMTKEQALWVARGRLKATEEYYNSLITLANLRDDERLDPKLRVQVAIAIVEAGGRHIPPPADPNATGGLQLNFVIPEKRAFPERMAAIDVTPDKRN